MMGYESDIEEPVAGRVISGRQIAIDPEYWLIELILDGSEDPESDPILFVGGKYGETVDDWWSHGTAIWAGREWSFANLDTDVCHKLMSSAMAERMGTADTTQHVLGPVGEKAEDLRLAYWNNTPLKLPKMRF